MVWSINSGMTQFHCVSHAPSTRRVKRQPLLHSFWGACTEILLLQLLALHTAHSPLQLDANKTEYPCFVGRIVTLFATLRCLSNTLSHSHRVGFPSDYGVPAILYLLRLGGLLVIVLLFVYAPKPIARWS